MDPVYCPRVDIFLGRLRLNLSIVPYVAEGQKRREWRWRAESWWRAPWDAPFRLGVSFDGEDRYDL